METIQHIITVISMSHPYIQAASVMGVALFIAVVALPFVSGIVRFATRKTETDVDDQLISALQGPTFYFVLLLGVQVALPYLLLPENLSAIGLSITKTLVVFVVAQALYRAVRILLEGASETNRISAVNKQTFPLFSNLTLIVVGAAALYGVFIVWGIDVTAWLASAGIIGIAVGFAAKDTLSNIISGIFILADKPYSVGDFIQIGSGTTGIVHDVGLRSTRIRTFNDEEVTVPNAVIANEEIINKTTGPDTGRVTVAVGVAYGSDVEKVKAILLACAENHELVLDDPAPAVRFVNFGDSSLDFKLICRVHEPLDVYVAQSDLHERINIAFTEANIEIPFPQRDVHMKQ